MDLFVYFKIAKIVESVETAYFNRSLIVMCEYIVNKSANGLGGKNPGIMCREKNPPVLYIAS